MRYIVAAVALFIASAGFAAEQRASEASIREMLRVTEAQKLLDSVFPQIEGMMKQGMEQGFANMPMSAEEKKAAAEMSEKLSAKMMVSMREQMQWSKLEPIYIQIYQKSFTQEEVDGMLDFYKTKAGAALIKKMPTVMQETMLAMQQLMGPMMQKVGQAVEESIEEFKAKKGKQ